MCGCFLIPPPPSRAKTLAHYDGYSQSSALRRPKSIQPMQSRSLILWLGSRLCRFLRTDMRPEGALRTCWMYRASSAPRRARGSPSVRSTARSCLRGASCARCSTGSVASAGTTGCARAPAARTALYCSNFCTKQQPQCSGLKHYKGVCHRNSTVLSKYYISNLADNHQSSTL